MGKFYILIFRTDVEIWDKVKLITVNWP